MREPDSWALDHAKREIATGMEDYRLGRPDLPRLCGLTACALLAIALNDLRWFARD